MFIMFYSKFESDINILLNKTQLSRISHGLPYKKLHLTLFLDSIFKKKSK